MLEGVREDTLSGWLVPRGGSSLRVVSSKKERRERVLRKNGRDIKKPKSEKLILFSMGNTHTHTHTHIQVNKEGDNNSIIYSERGGHQLSE